ncbi:hypothetical protein L204_104394 [Cryptococcus depauperatus]|nr:hypothetical protein L204_04774 [Cryptococcus depauperatus CBS 7855]
MLSILLMAPLLNILPLFVVAFDCSLTVSSIAYDISLLSGRRTASKDTSTPPTTSKAKVTMDLCSSGIGREDGVSDEDQCPSDTKVCLKLLNHKPSSPDPDRVTSVVPIWTADTPDEDVTITPLGKNGDQGLKIDVKGPDYAGTQQYLNLTLSCDLSSTDRNPTFISYTSGSLSLKWATADACPKSAHKPKPSYSSRSNSGFFGFLKVLFWLCIMGLILYFVIGVVYNHQQYSARGWDLVPHRDFWREVPVLLQDLFSHLFAGIRGHSAGGNRGGYSSLG